MKATQLTGMPVISIAEGVKAGQVIDITIHATSPQVDSLVLSTDREQTMLSFEAIRVIGPDAVMIDELRWVRGERPSDTDESTRRFTRMVGKETAGDDGTYLGDLKDFEIDPITGQIESILLHRGGLMGIGGEDLTVPGDNLHAFGSRLLTVAPPAPTEEQTAAAASTDSDESDPPKFQSVRAM